MQILLMLVMVVGMAAFVVSGLMRADRPMVMSLGIALASLGLNGICGALIPRWERGWWKPHGSRPPTVRVGRLSSFGFGVMVGAVGTCFLGYGWLPEAANLALFAAVVAGFVLMMVGGKHDGRRAETGQAIDQTPQGSGESLT